MPKKKKPFKPFISVDQILAFQKDKPETFTSSPFVNAVLEAIDELGYSNSSDIAGYLDLEIHHVSFPLQVATGFTLTDLRRLLMQRKVAEIREKSPFIGPDELAKKLGFHDRSALWRQGIKGTKPRNSCGDAWKVFHEEQQHLLAKSRK